MKLHACVLYMHTAVASAASSCNCQSAVTLAAMDMRMYSETVASAWYVAFFANRHATGYQAYSCIIYSNKNIPFLQTFTSK